VLAVKVCQRVFFIFFVFKLQMQSLNIVLFAIYYTIIKNTFICIYYLFFIHYISNIILSKFSTSNKILIKQKLNNKRFRAYMVNCDDDE